MTPILTAFTVWPLRGTDPQSPDFLLNEQLEER